jgi:hypothetical protein
VIWWAIGIAAGWFLAASATVTLFRYAALSAYKENDWMGELGLTVGPVDDGGNPQMPPPAAAGEPEPPEEFHRSA